MSQGVRIRYNGTGLSLRGDKDRFVLPAPFRKDVIRSSDDKPLLLIKQHPQFECLAGYGKSREAEIEAEIERDEANAVARGEPFDRDMAYVSRCGGAASASFDSSGRFVLPAVTRALGMVDDRIFFYGVGPVILMFDPARLMALTDPGWREAQAHCRVVLAEAGMAA